MREAEAPRPFNWNRQRHARTAPTSQARTQTNERADLGQRIRAHQETLAVPRDLTLHEIELAKVTVRVLVKLERMLAELAGRNQQ